MLIATLRPLPCTWPSGPIRLTRIRPPTAPSIGAGEPARFPAFCAPSLPGLDDGGVYLNVGSAVVLPEVFLKAVSADRNVGHPAERVYYGESGFPTALPSLVNVVQRPHAESGGRGLRA